MIEVIIRIQYLWQNPNFSLGVAEWSGPSIIGFSLLTRHYLWVFLFRRSWVSNRRMRFRKLTWWVTLGLITECVKCLSSSASGKLSNDCRLKHDINTFKKSTAIYRAEFRFPQCSWVMSGMLLKFIYSTAVVNFEGAPPISYWQCMLVQI